MSRRWQCRHGMEPGWLAPSWAVVHRPLLASFSLSHSPQGAWLRAHVLVPTGDTKQPHSQVADGAKEPSTAKARQGQSVKIGLLLARTGLSQTAAILRDTGQVIMLNPYGTQLQYRAARLVVKRWEWCENKGWRRKMARQPWRHVIHSPNGIWKTLQPTVLCLLEDISLNLCF